MSLAALGLLLGGVSAPAQELVWQSPGVLGRYINGIMSVIGDVNGDGYEDVVAGVDGWCAGASRGGLGYVWVISGFDGALLREVESATPTAMIMGVTSAGDFNDDGVADFATAQWDPSGNATLVHSGSDGSLLRLYQGNWDELVLLSDLDVDGDGHEDMIIAAPRSNSYYGTVRVYSHQGALLYRLDGDATNPTVMTIGKCLANLGDVNGDQCDDFVMGCGEPTGRGAGVVVSGRDGTYLRVCNGELPYDGLFYSIDTVGDLDGDGIQDFVMGNGGGSFLARSVMRVFSTATGQVLHQWVDQNRDHGITVSSRGVDLDGDGLGDIIAGNPWHPVPPSMSGASYAYSGRDGSIFHQVLSARWPPSPMNPNGGSGRVGVFADLLQPPNDTGWMIVYDSFGPAMNVFPCFHNAGALLAYRGLPRTSRVLGPGCAGNLASPPQVGMRSTPSGVRVHLSHAPSNVPAVLMLGMSTSQFLGVSLPAPLDPAGFPGCFLRSSIEVCYVTMTGNVGTDAGYVYVDLPHPVPTVGPGAYNFSAQWLVLGDAATFPGGLTEAIAWRR